MKAFLKETFEKLMILIMGVFVVLIVLAWFASMLGNPFPVWSLVVFGGGFFLSFMYIIR